MELVRHLGTSGHSDESPDYLENGDTRRAVLPWRPIASREQCHPRSTAPHGSASSTDSKTGLLLVIPPATVRSAT
ncbi:hypothetical protein PSCLAVI8L_150208 [Pseudoclavibacter sp. 8L]|nr:hypothetical protein PSCLAVI8L_150208 [Pseudoclavibacter sp. 8L]